MSWLSQWWRKPSKPMEPTPSHPAPRNFTPWMPVVLKEDGFRELAGNRGIEKYIKGAKVGRLGDPWCAIFVNWGFESVGIPGTRSALARSFESHPNFVKLSGPAYGCVGTMWRGSRASGKGHVFFYVGHNDDGYVVGLGGNQRDGVRKQIQPADRIVGWYWPKGVPLPKTGKVLLVDDNSEVGSET